MLSFGFRTFCWYRGFCHRTGSDLLLFLFKLLYPIRQTTVNVLYQLSVLKDTSCSILSDVDLDLLHNFFKHNTH